MKAELAAVRQILAEDGTNAGIGVVGVSNGGFAVIYVDHVEVQLTAKILYRISLLRGRKCRDRSEMRGKRNAGYHVRVSVSLLDCVSKMAVANQRYRSRLPECEIAVGHNRAC